MGCPSVGGSGAMPFDHGEMPTMPNGAGMPPDMPTEPPTEEAMIQFFMDQGMTLEEAQAKYQEMLANGFNSGIPPSVPSVPERKNA